MEQVVSAKRSARAIVEQLKNKRVSHPPDVVLLVQKFRAASFKMGGTDLKCLFTSIDKDNSGNLDFMEFKKAVRR